MTSDVMGNPWGGTDTIDNQFRVYINDATGDPVPNAVVEIDLSPCPDLRLCTAQPFYSFGVLPVVTCGAGVKKITLVASTSGIADFLVLGSSIHDGASPGCGYQACPVRASSDGVNFVVLRNVTVSAFDHTCQNGIDVLDLSAFQADRFSGQYFGRSDLDGDHVIGVLDLSMMSAARYSSGPFAAAERCPSQGSAANRNSVVSSPKTRTAIEWAAEGAARNRPWSSPRARRFVPGD